MLMVIISTLAVIRIAVVAGGARNVEAFAQEIIYIWPWTEPPSEPLDGANRTITCLELATCLSGGSEIDQCLDGGGAWVGPSTIWLERMLYVWAVVPSCFKILYFLGRIEWKGLSAYSRFLLEVFSDSFPFITILTVFILGFAIVFWTIDDSYAEEGRHQATMIPEMFYWMLGNVEGTLEYTAVTKWSHVIFFILLITVVMANALIAITGETLNRVRDDEATQMLIIKPAFMSDVEKLIQQGSGARQWLLARCCKCRTIRKAADWAYTSIPCVDKLVDGPFHAIVFGLEVVLFAVLVVVFAVSACFSTVSAAAFYDVARSLVASAVLLVASLVLHTHGAMRPRHFHVLLRGYDQPGRIFDKQTDDPAGKNKRLIEKVNLNVTNGNAELIKNVKSTNHLIAKFTKQLEAQKDQLSELNRRIPAAQDQLSEPAAQKGLQPADASATPAALGEEATQDNRPSFNG